MPILGILDSAKTGRLSTNAFESIATASANGGGSFSFTSIPQTFTHLQLRVSMASTRGDNLDGTSTTINGVGTGTPYFGHGWYGEQYNGGSQAISGYNGGGGSGNNASIIPTYITGNNNAGIPTTYTWDFLNYTSTSRMKTYCMYNGGMTSASYQSSVSGMRINTFTSLNAITSIQFSMDYGGTYTNTTVALYGVK